jgi:hypothetical protein
LNDRTVSASFTEIVNWPAGGDELACGLSAQKHIFSRSAASKPDDFRAAC